MRIAINGYGRIGRCVLRAWHERRGDRARLGDGLSTGLQSTDPLSIVAINELASADAISYLTTYDSTHGRFPADIRGTDNTLSIDNHSVALLREADHAQLPWADHDIDLVLECTGEIITRDSATGHVDAGARQVLLSNPGEPDIPALVYGINHQLARRDQPVLSAASCTSNALIPVLSVLDSAFGIDNGVITTIHASMHDQPVIDAYHSADLRRNRAASQSIIPVDTTLAQGIERVLPQLRGKFVAQALRVPVNNVSALNVTVNIGKRSTVEAVNAVLQEASQQQLTGVLGYTEALLASCDFNHDVRSGVIDANQTRISAGTTVNVLIWFDNEWAFANRMLDLSLYLAAK